jgi:hypothetical protein
MVAASKTVTSIWAKSQGPGLMTTSQIAPSNQYLIDVAGPSLTRIPCEVYVMKTDYSIEQQTFNTLVRTDQISNASQVQVLEACSLDEACNSSTACAKDINDSSNCLPLYSRSIAG